jgi:hypothetical protein
MDNEHDVLAVAAVAAVVVGVHVRASCSLPPRGLSQYGILGKDCHRGVQWKNQTIR